MTRRPGMRDLSTGLALALLVSLVAPAAAGRLVAPSPGEGRAGALVFLDSWTETVLPLPVAELRLDAERQLEVALQLSGRTVVMTDGLMRLAGVRRVRSAAALSPRFLADLRDLLGIDELVIVQLIVEPQRLLMLARSLDTAQGLVWQLWQAEEPVGTLLLGDDLDAGRAALLDALTRALRSVSEGGRVAAPDPERPRALLLPATPIGCSLQEGLLATHVLLARAAGDGRAAYVDPAYAAAVLLDAGLDPRRLDGEARALLSRTFDAQVVARPILMAYGSGPLATPRAIGNDPDERIGPRSLVSSFWLALQDVDLRDGTLVNGADLYVQHQGRTGWFGQVDRTSLLTRLQDATRTLWHDYRTSLEDI
ncbi:MAG: hypothetical protein R3D98_06710 [Candidatus Krumholzibacteriia bacterium]